MDPVRVKVYGLVSMTRRGYLVQLTAAVVFAAGLLVLWAFRWPAVRQSLQSGPSSPVMEQVIAFWDHAPWFLGGICLLLAVEAWIVLRRFARKEAERKSVQPPKTA